MNKINTVANIVLCCYKWLKAYRIVDLNNLSYAAHIIQQIRHVPVLKQLDYSYMCFEA